MRIPIMHCIAGNNRLLIVLHYRDIADAMIRDLSAATTWDEALRIKMTASEAEFYRDAETNVKVRNGMKGGRSHHTYPQLRKARLDSKPLNYGE